jgi:hypothetical protein
MAAKGGYFDSPTSGSTTSITTGFQPGVIVFICTDQQTDGWEHYDNTGEVSWQTIGVAAWSSLSKAAINNGAMAVRHGATTAATGHGSGMYDGYSLWMRETYGGSNTMLGYVSSLDSDGFTITWVTTTSSYRVYWVAGEDQQAYAKYASPLNEFTGLNTNDNSEAQGGFQISAGIGSGAGGGGGNGTVYNTFINANIGMWSRPAEHYPYTTSHGAKGGYSELAYEYTDNCNNAAHTNKYLHIDQPGTNLVFSANTGIASSIVPCWSWLCARDDDTGTVVFNHGFCGIDSNCWQQCNCGDNWFQGFAWATGKNNSCQHDYVNTSALGANDTGDYQFTFQNDPSHGIFQDFVPEWGITVGIPSPDNDDFELGHTWGLWAMDENGDFFHALIASGNDRCSGRLTRYRGTDYSWCSSFAISGSGGASSATAGTMEVTQPGYLTVTKTIDNGTYDYFNYFFNGYNGPLPQKKFPQFYRWVHATAGGGIGGSIATGTQGILAQEGGDFLLLEDGTGVILTEV